MRFFNKTILFTLLISASGCAENEDDLSFQIDPNKIAALTNQATEQVTINGTTLELFVYLQRDFMPVYSSGSPKLSSVNFAVDLDSISIPESVQLIEQYVINGDSIWTANYNSEDYNPLPYVIHKVSLNGPTWQTGKEVTVISKLLNSDDGSTHYLIKEHQVII